MIRVRPLNNLREVYEAPGSMTGRPVDGLLFLSTKRIAYTGEEKTLASAQTYEILELELGFEDHPGQKTVMMVDDQDRLSNNFIRMMTHATGGGTI